MLEGAVMEYAKWFVGIVSVMFISLAVIFMFQLNQVNGFQQEINYQIERYGGLTDDAKIELNNYAKKAYGGCLVVSTDDGAECLFPADRGTDVATSGFFVREYKVNPDGSLVYYDRPNDSAATYGTPIRYALTRQIGYMATGSFLKPGVTGKSSSRVRGVVSE